MKKRRSNRRKHATGMIFLVVGMVLMAACVFLYIGENNFRMAATQVSNSITSTLTEESSASSSQVQEPTVTTLHFSATGDNLIHDGLYLQASKRAGGDGYDFQYLYENVAPFYQNFDINWINQETLVTDELPPSSYPCFCTPGDLAREMYDIGFRVFSLSNNHSYDKGAQGIAATRRFWDSMPDDVVTTGLFAGENDYYNIPIQEKNGVRIAYLAYTDSTNGIPTPQDATANIIYTSQEDIIQFQIEQARSLADIVVVGVHWGTENSHIVNDAQRSLAQKIANWGADIIIGTHPHVVQTIEVLTDSNGKQVPVAYSLGNFVSTQIQADNLIGIILTFDIVKTTQPDGTVSSCVIDNVKAIPEVMHYDANFQNARAYLFRDYTDELAASHGNGSLSRTYIQSVLEENIPAEYLVLE
ncbi:CapA family protein [uncultured Ruthenibacterium sp.]|uniref:CapA family protein n=1 Tax=uncultured Ruthenibacterium sp. TaxID=1905347 RepID=UPI00349E6309